jgi:hypothetical protein
VAEVRFWAEGEKYVPTTFEARGPPEVILHGIGNSVTTLPVRVRDLFAFAVEFYHCRIRGNK